MQDEDGIILDLLIYGIVRIQWSIACREQLSECRDFQFLHWVFFCYHWNAWKFRGCGEQDFAFQSTKEGDMSCLAISQRGQECLGLLENGKIRS